MTRKKRHPMKMTRVELTKRVAKKAGFTQTDVAKVVNAVFDTIIEMLTEGKHIEIRSFATFKVVNRKERIRRNPRTGEKAMAPAHRAPVFKPARRIKDKVNAVVADIQDPEGEER